LRPSSGTGTYHFIVLRFIVVRSGDAVVAVGADRECEDHDGASAEDDVAEQADAEWTNVFPDQNFCQAELNAGLPQK